MPTLKGTEASLSYVQRFLYLVSSSVNVSLFHIAWLDTFRTDCVCALAEWSCIRCYRLLKISIKSLVLVGLPMLPSVTSCVYTVSLQIAFDYLTTLASHESLIFLMNRFQGWWSRTHDLFHRVIKGPGPFYLTALPSLACDFSQGLKMVPASPNMASVCPPGRRRGKD